MASEQYMAQKERANPQGAQPTERSENERAALANSATGEVYATENTENERAETVAN